MGNFPKLCPTYCGFCLAPVSKIGVHGRLDKRFRWLCPHQRGFRRTSLTRRSESNGGLHANVRDDGYYRDHLFQEVTNKTPYGVTAPWGVAYLAGHGGTMTLGQANSQALEGSIR